MCVTESAQDEFEKALKANLIKAGRQNVSIDESSLEENQKKAMENIAAAFSEPIKNFIDRESSQSVGSDIVSYDHSVDVHRIFDPITLSGRVDLSVSRCVSDSIEMHNQDSLAHPDIRQEISNVNDKGLFFENGQLRFG